MSGRFHINEEKKTSPQKTTRFFFIQLQQVRKQTETMIRHLRMKEQDESVQWADEPQPVPVSGVSRLRRWIVPAVSVTVILVLIINLGVSYVTTSYRLWSVETRVSNLSNVIETLSASLQNAQDVTTSNRLRSVETRVSNLSNVIETLSASLQNAQESAEEAQRLHSAVEDRLTSDVTTSNRLRSVEKTVSNLSNVIETLSASLQNAQESAEKAQVLHSAVEDRLTSVLEALKQLSAIDSLSRSPTSNNCSLEQIINNSTGLDGCCPPDWKPSGLSCYFFSSSALSWNDSRAWCEDHESHLVILSSDRDWDFVTRHTRSNFFWVGLSDWRTGMWEWVDQTPYSMDSRQWRPGQPDNWTGHRLGPGGEDCAHLHRDGRLNDQHCSIKMQYICQKRSGDP
ncbi:asialoglycoprotein receptor 1 isoform X1 [Pleuronectes platessa]|uniref:asialoglycoprotein receptor 1 isoform X1 n=1 Tax=Pleuronectes platessa TaxID=8262 RepID=UPI00232A14DA|nr:asialoglycoprotein receptor 1 isoform X1 [Pleuronectes platessa]